MAEVTESTPPRRIALRALAWWVVLAAGGVATLLIAAAVWLLIWLVGRTTDPDLARAQLDAVRTALSVGLGAGGALAYWLAARRQRATELSILHQEQVADDARRDATERRITELYTKAVEQLGSEKGPVRLGGLYALERLGQDNPGHRQTIVNVVCAYLRMPYTPVERLRQRRATSHHQGNPVDETPNASQLLGSDHKHLQEERQVRLAAQKLIADHLRPYRGPSPTIGDPQQDQDGSNPKFWNHISIDLSGATLVRFDFSSCRVSDVRFAETVFIGDTQFGGSVFEGQAWFGSAVFHGRARFGGVKFSSVTSFDDVEFASETRFSGARFKAETRFENVRFAKDIRFTGCDFFEDAWFGGTRFGGYTRFDKARFHQKASFGRARFAGETLFKGATFSSDARFGGVDFARGAEFTSARFDGYLDLTHTNIDLTNASIASTTDAADQ